MGDSALPIDMQLRACSKCQFRKRRTGENIAITDNMIHQHRIIAGVNMIFPGELLLT